LLHKMIRQETRSHKRPREQERDDVPTSAESSHAADHTYLPHQMTNVDQNLNESITKQLFSKCQELERVIARKDEIIKELQEEINQLKEENEDLEKRLKELNKSPKKTSQSRYWRKDEHERFLEAVQKFGKKDVKAIAQYVQTRSPTQVRTHAQKWFLKQKREAERRNQQQERILMEREERMQREWLRLQALRQESNYIQHIDVSSLTPLNPMASTPQPLATTSNINAPNNFGLLTPPPPPPPTLPFTTTLSPSFVPLGMTNFNRKVTPDPLIVSPSTQSFSKVPMIDPLSITNEEGQHLYAALKHYEHERDWLTKLQLIQKNFLPHRSLEELNVMVNMFNDFFVASSSDVDMKKTQVTSPSPFGNYYAPHFPWGGTAIGSLNALGGGSRTKSVTGAEATLHPREQQALLMQLQTGHVAPQQLDRVSSEGTSAQAVGLPGVSPHPIGRETLPGGSPQPLPLQPQPPLPPPSSSLSPSLRPPPPPPSRIQSPPSGVVSTMPPPPLPSSHPPLSGPSGSSGWLFRAGTPTSPPPAISWPPDLSLYPDLHTETLSHELSKTPTVVNANALQSLSESVFSSNPTETPEAKHNSVAVSSNSNATFKHDTNSDSNINGSVMATTNNDNNKDNTNASDNNNSNTSSNNVSKQSENLKSNTPSIALLPEGEDEEEDPEIKSLTQIQRRKKNSHNQSNGTLSHDLEVNQQETLPPAAATTATQQQQQQQQQQQTDNNNNILQETTRQQQPQSAFNSLNRVTPNFPGINVTSSFSQSPQSMSTPLSFSQLMDQPKQ
jgi:SHAQKYF class myb-like DNA-binding protein